MGFKKNNINKASPLVPNLIGLVALCLIFLFGLVLIKNIEFFNLMVDTDNSLNPNTQENSQDIISTGKNETNNTANIIEEKLKAENKINILVVGRGGGSHDAPNLTDTIILASINTKIKTISMLSIPRDFYVNYPGKDKDGKINGLYAKYKFESSSAKTGMEILKKKVSEITGEEIDYFINVDFNGFIDIIDTIGGIEIEIPTHFIDNEYPDGNWGYKTLVFKKGTWIFDGDNALKYARSRHSTSDFDRSMRQQQVIKAIKDKLSGSYFLTSPLKVKELYDVFVNRVYTDLKLSTIIKLAYQLNSTTDFKVISSNLNDSCFYGSSNCKTGGFLYTPSRDFFGGMSVLLAEGTNISTLSNYEILHKYTNIVFNYPKIFEKDYKINIFNSLKINHLAGELSNNIVRYGFNIPLKNSIGNTSTLYPKSVIYFNNIDSNSPVINALKNFYDGEFIQIYSPKYSKDNANIEIIIGEDYLGDNNKFKF
ncbi:MAG: LCP family protein [Candidatus Gracilibacteria bacterium]